MTISKLKCYNCNIELNQGIYTREHIPAKNLFLEATVTSPIITVDACITCNNLFSKIDNEMRDAVAVVNDSTEVLQKFTAKGVRSILRKKDFNRLHTNIFGQVVAVDFNKNLLDAFHIKNFKGLFYHTYNFPLPDTLKIDTISDGDNSKKIELAKDLYGIADDCDWKISGSENIFKYKFLCLTQSNENGFEISDSFDNSFIVYAIMIYHNKLLGTVVATVN